MYLNEQAMKTILTILSIVFSIVAYSQIDTGSFIVNQSDIDLYLDSISNVYAKSAESYKKQNLLAPIKSGREGYYYIFGDSVKLLAVPDSKSNYKTLLNFGDIILIPRYKGLPKFHGQFQYSPLYFSINSGNYHSYVFCVTEQGNYGFIKTNEYYDQYNDIQLLPNTDYLLIKYPKKAIVKKDYSKYKIFDAYDINYSLKHNSLVYSIEGSRFDSPGKIFTFNINSWTENYIGQGYSPIFIEDDIIYWTKKDEKIHRYNFVIQVDSIIFSVPDSLTMWLCGPDNCFPLKIRTKNINNQNLIYLNFCSKIIKPGEDECGTEVKFLITRKGEIIEIE